jgi:ribosomal protein S18 acetylase RimI-like enzyme
MNIKYRQFKISDSKAVSELVKSLYREDPGGKPMSSQKIQNTFDSLAEHPDRGTIIVIENEEKVIGYAILINFWSNEFGGNIVNIDELYIKEEFRSKGITTNFIKYLVENKFSNSVALQLEVTPENTKAQSLYENFGFKPHRNRILILELKTRI